MISVDDAYKMILSHIADFGVEEIPLHQAHGRVIREQWYTDRALPPYDRVTMDGISILFSDWESGQRTFTIEEVAAAGEPIKTMQNLGNCMEVMTGSVVPNNTDTVIRYEDLDIKNGIAEVIQTVRPQQNIHFKGQDKQKDVLVLERGQTIGSPEIGLGASIGKAFVNVSKMPKVIVISTGDELVDIEETPLAHQIRKGNVFRIASTLNSMGINCKTDHLNDELENIVEKLERYVQEYDVLVLSGGVSKGKFDFLPEALDRIGVQKHFHKIAQRPGKPMWFGTHAEKKCTVFALPGNPVSSFMCTHVYLLDWLCISTGNSAIHRPLATLAAEVSFSPDLVYFLEVEAKQQSDGKIYALPKKGNGSGDLVNLTRANAFIRLPQGRDKFLEGEMFPLYYYR